MYGEDDCGGFACLEKGLLPAASRHCIERGVIYVLAGRYCRGSRYTAANPPLYFSTDNAILLQFLQNSTAVQLDGVFIKKCCMYNVVAIYERHCCNRINSEEEKNNCNMAEH